MGKMIIIIDNSCSKKDFVREALAEGDYSVVDAAGPEAAIEAVRDGARAGLAVICLHTPGLNAPAIISSIRKADGFARTPILLLVNEAGDEEQIAWKEAGATAWVTGPLTSEKVLSAVRTMFF